jgi:hypothetical protein
LIIDCIVPWGLIQEGICNNSIDLKPRTSLHEDVVNTDEGVIKCIRQTSTFLTDQLAISQNKYRKFIGEQCVEEEDEEIVFHWYYRFEMQLLLEKAGFQVVDIVNKKFEKGLDSTIFVAQPRGV